MTGAEGGGIAPTGGGHGSGVPGDVPEPRGYRQNRFGRGRRRHRRSATFRASISSSTPKIVEEMKKNDLEERALLGGGSFLPEDIPKMKEMGVDEVFRGGSLTESFVDYIKEHVRSRRPSMSPKRQDSPQELAGKASWREPAGRLLLITPGGRRKSTD